MRGIRVEFDETLRLEGAIPCAKCGLLLDDDRQMHRETFDGKVVTCRQCGNAIVLWNVARKLIDRVSAHFGTHYLLAGCTQSVGTVIPTPNELMLVDLEALVGNGSLLQVDYLCLGEVPVIALPWPVAELLPKRPVRSANFFAYCPVDTDIGNTKIQISCWYAQEELRARTSTRLMIDAFRDYRAEQFDRMVVAANTCMETLCNAFLREVLDSTGIGGDGIRRFLTDGATYGHQLSVVLPMVTRLSGRAIPEERVMSGLRKLNKLRNKVVHEGKVLGTEESDMLGETLTAAYCGFKYFTCYLGVDN
jgi:hypothetical protein